MSVDNSTMSPQMLSSSKGVTWCALYSTVAFLVVLFNLVTMVTFIFDIRLRRRRSMYCLMNLAVADMLVGSLPMPLAVYTFGLMSLLWGKLENLTPTWIMFLTGAHMFTGFLSLLSLALVSLERAFAVVYPLRMRAVKSRMYFAAILVTWCLGFISTGVYIAYGDNSKVSFFAWIIPCLVAIVVIFVSYVIIYFQVKRQHTIHQQREMRTAIKRERYLAFTLFIVTVMSLVTWLPHVIVQCVWFLEAVPITFEQNNGTICLMYANSIGNPVVYVLRMKDFRRGLVRVLCREGNRVNPSDLTQTHEVNTAAM
ncbi:galanin receptor 2a [Nematostella vectensis]|uniref:galanin receptor 2a n=1 Tax=Nematostella vectensis TaxID=45351 RepID=UPI0020773AF3|nr:galanin receptor 2a [Nematostella vectensis]XP_048578994.1 galanin receptor 2a [Nematostella vectensis]